MINGVLMPYKLAYEHYFEQKTLEVNAAVHTDFSLNGNCRASGTTISLSHLNFHQKDAWLPLQRLKTVYYYLRIFYKF